MKQIPYKKIDIHCHATNRPLRHTVSSDASIFKIREEMNKHNIAQTVLLATYFPLKGTGVSNYRMRSWADTYYSDFLMFGSLDFEHYYSQGFNELQEMAEYAHTHSRGLISGIKIYSGYQNIAPGKLYEVLQLCDTYKLPIMFHTGDCTGTNGVHADIAQYDYLLEHFVNVNFIYSHLGNPKIDNIIERINRFPHLFTDMSGLLHSGKEDHELPVCVDLVRKLYDNCGTQQLMWGTDFPVQTHEHSVYIAEKSLHDIATDAELQRFYYGNAEMVLGLRGNLNA